MCQAATKTTSTSETTPLSFYKVKINDDLVKLLKIFNKVQMLLINRKLVAHRVSVTKNAACVMMYNMIILRKHRSLKEQGRNG